VAEDLSSDDGTCEGSLERSPFQAVFTGTNLRPDVRSRETGSSASGVLARSLLLGGGQGENPSGTGETNSFTASQNRAFRVSTSFFIAAGVREGGRRSEYLITYA